MPISKYQEERLNIQAQLDQIREHLEGLRKELQPLALRMEGFAASDVASRNRIAELVNGLQTQITRQEHQIDDIETCLFGDPANPRDIGIKGVVQVWDKWWWAIWVSVLSALAFGLWDAIKHFLFKDGG